jgi:hypothetical protein
MSTFGFVRLFSSPLLAFFVSAIVVSAWGYLIYRDGRHKGSRHWKLLSLVAEVCVAVGLIGLATFAGRMKVGADHQLLEERVGLSQAAVDDRMRLAALDSCAPASPRPLAPYNPSVAKKELCAIAGSFKVANASAADREAAELSLRDFTSKYPGCVENVFSRHSECSNVVTSATQLADELRILETSKQTARDDESIAAILEAPNSWGFLLLAFVIAALGVSIKCARAAAEYFNAAKSP